MPDLLIHSMSEFAEIIFGSLERTGASDVVEIGAEYGLMTGALLEYTARKNGSFTTIDPAPAPEMESRLADHPHGRLIRRRSLEALPELTADAWMVDGDHNYYTVLNESELIHERCRETGRPFLAFYHDVGWPCARRDLYYDPASIPGEHRHPHRWDMGLRPGDPGLVAGGFRGEGHWAAALTEGGPRNGVLTALEDFSAAHENELLYAHVPAVFGLGILFDRVAPWAGELTNFLAPWHRSRLLERLEENRLACYLRVIEMQDMAATATGATR